jgi:hypothetical protein
MKKQDKNLIDNLLTIVRKLKNTNKYMLNYYYVKILFSQNTIILTLVYGGKPDYEKCYY